MQRTRTVLAWLVLSAACGSSDTAPGTASPTETSSGGTSGNAPATGTSAGPAGASGSTAGTSGQSSSAPGNAGASGLSGSMQMDAHVCTIPDDIEITLEDGDDAGVAPDCQNVPRKIIANNCIGGICHDSSGPPAGGIDLMAPCVADRLVNVKSSCDDMFYLDPNNLERSFLYNKVSGVPAPRCGKLMPDGRRLEPEQLRCMNAWIKAVLRAASGT